MAKGYNKSNTVIAPDKNPPWRMSPYDPDNHPRIAYEVLSCGKTIAHVAVECGVCKATIYNWAKQEDKKDFLDAISKGKAVAEALWADIGYRGMTGEIKAFNSTVWEKNMEVRFSGTDITESWRKTKDLNANIRSYTVTDMTDEELEQIIKKYDD